MAKSQATFMKKQLEKNRQKKKEDKLEPQQVADVLTGEVLPQDNRYLQVGGNETVGMGWFAVQFSQQAAQ